MNQYIISYITTLAALLILDFLWLGIIAKNFYQKNLAGLLAANMNWTVVGVFYILYAAGIIFFAVKPAQEINSVAKAMAYGALFGFFCYATYNLTNLATLKDWPKTVMATDIIWGSLMTGLAAVVGFIIINQITK